MIRFKLHAFSSQPIASAISKFSRILLMVNLAVVCIFSQIVNSSEPANIAQSEKKILDPTFELKKVAGDCKFTEGPVVNGEGVLFFSDSENNRIMQRDAEGNVSVFRQPSGRANGMMFDYQGRMLLCQSMGHGGLQRVVRLEEDGTETVLAEKYEGSKFVAPNDLCVDHQGRNFFTDPIYGDPKTAPQPTSGVYRIDAPGKVTRIISNLKRPNGILITPDDKTLFVSDRGTQKLHRYQIQSDGSVKPDGILYDFAPDRGIDGMWMDEQGNIYGAAGENETTGLFVISPKGKLLLHYPLPEYATNVTLGGKNRRDLYITAGKSVYQLRTLIPGVPVPSTVSEK